MKLIELYESETGEKAIYHKGSSDYHTLRYIRWLENRAFQQSNTADGNNSMSNPYLLAGNELTRTERAAKNGSRR